MAKPLNFNNVKKRYLTVTLADEKNTTLMIGTPTKQILEDLLILQSSLDEIEEDGENSNPEVVDDLYNACARVMSRNKCGIKITNEFLSDLFDLEDLIIFFNAYMDFVNEITNSKN